MIGLAADFTGGLVEVEVLASRGQAFIKDLKIYRTLYGCVDVAESPYSGNFEPSLPPLSNFLETVEHRALTAAIRDSVWSTSALLVKYGSHQVLVPTAQSALYGYHHLLELF